jgi:hypothetical protein
LFLKETPVARSGYGQRQQAANNQKYSTKGTKMKRLIITTTLIATTLIAGSIASADGFDRARHAPKATQGSLKVAVNIMVQSIERSLGIFEGLNRSQQEKMAEFDNILAQINYSIKVTAADGSLAKKISGAVSLANQQAEWCAKTADAKDNPQLSEKYRRLGEIAADKAMRIEKNAALVLAMNTELAALYPAIMEEKKFFYTAAVVGDLGTANESLKGVHRDMKKVIDILKRLGGLGDQFNAPAPVFARR